MYMMCMGEACRGSEVFESILVSTFISRDQTQVFRLVPKEPSCQALFLSIFREIKKKKAPILPHHTD